MAEAPAAVDDLQPLDFLARWAVDRNGVVRSTAAEPATDAPTAAPTEAELQQTYQEIADALVRANPKYKTGEIEYSRNCMGVAQVYELRRRGLDVQTGSTTRILEAQVFGVPADTPAAVSRIWRRPLSLGTNDEIVEAFKGYGDGSRGVVFVFVRTGGGHLFNVENVDAQRRPLLIDAALFFDVAKPHAFYLRLDDLQTPDLDEFGPYLE